MAAARGCATRRRAGQAAPGGAPRLRRLALAWREPGTRLGLWTHFVSQFSGTVFALLWGYPFLVVGEHRTPAQAGLLITLLVVVAMGIGPTVGHFAGRWPYRRSLPVLADPGRHRRHVDGRAGVARASPAGLLVVLVVVLASNGPASLLGFDYARTENEAERLGSATGIVNVGGFVASLLTIALIGVVLSLRSTAGRRATPWTTFAWPSRSSTSSGGSASPACCTTAGGCGRRSGSSSTRCRAPSSVCGADVAIGGADAQPAALRVALRLS